MMNLIRFFIFSVGLLVVNADAQELSGSARADWPDNLNAAEVVRYLVEPFGYDVIIDNKAGKDVETIQPHLLRDPYHVAPVEQLILRIIPSDIGVKIDEQNRRIQFHYVRDMVQGGS